MAYLLDILSNSLKILFLRRCNTYAVSRTILFRHRVLNSSCWVMQSMFWSLELSNFSYSLQHLHSINVCRTTQLLLHLHQCRFSILLESRSSSELLEEISLISSTGGSLSSSNAVYSGSWAYPDVDASKVVSSESLE